MVKRKPHFGKACIPVVLIAIVSFFGLMSPANADGPVSVKTSMATDKSNAENVIVKIEIEIEDGWHIYDTVPKDEPGIVTKISFEAPKGVKSVGKMKRPASLPYGTSGAFVFEGKVLFASSFRVEASENEREIEVKVLFQACNDRLCQPPKTVKKKIKIPAAKKTSNKFTNEHFEAPIMMVVGSNPLNNSARQMYPSPAMFDVDNDGKMELVVGDIFGSINVYENENNKAGDPIWAKHIRLKTADGEKIKVSNW